MLAIFYTWLSTALSLLVVDLVVPGVELSTVSAAMVAAVILGLVNAFVKPVISVLSLPLNLVTLGAFSIIVNGFCFWLASLTVSGFAVGGLFGFILGPVILSLVNTALSKYFADKNPDLALKEMSD